MQYRDIFYSRDKMKFELTIFYLLNWICKSTYLVALLSQLQHNKITMTRNNYYTVTVLVPTQK